MSNIRKTSEPSGVQNLLKQWVLFLECGQNRQRRYLEQTFHSGPCSRLLLTPCFVSFLNTLYLPPGSSLNPMTTSLFPSQAACLKISTTHSPRQAGFDLLSLSWTTPVSLPGSMIQFSAVAALDKAAGDLSLDIPGFVLAWFFCCIRYCWSPTLMKLPREEYSNY